MRRFLVVLACLSLIALDQGTKILAGQYLVHGQSVPVIPNLFNLTLVYNPGAAFGLFGGLPDMTRRIVLMLVSMGAFVVVYIMYKDTKDDPYSVAALTMIVAGAIGNLIDRVRYDAVVDFLDFYWGTYHWPAFNIADMCICGGVAVLVGRMLFAHDGDNIADRPESREHKATSSI